MKSPGVEEWKEFNWTTSQEIQFQYYAHQLNLHALPHVIVDIIGNYASDGLNRVGHLFDLRVGGIWVVAQVDEVHDSHIHTDVCGWGGKWIHFSNTDRFAPVFTQTNNFSDCVLPMPRAPSSGDEIICLQFSSKYGCK